jgi:biopolymer transport protein ExbD
MRRIRRSDMPVRFELTPLLDVVFLLLCFFVFVVSDDVHKMINFKLLPVKFVALGAGGGTAWQPGSSPDTIRIDPAGELYFDEERVTLPQLDAKLAQMAADPARNKVYVALQAGGTVDRAPVYGMVMDVINAHKPLEMVKVGQPGEQPPVPAP